MGTPMIQKDWGNYQILTQDFPVCVKILTIKPHSRLSLQTHQHRSEVWFALDTGLLAKVNKETIAMQPQERIIVPIGAEHRLSNPTDHTIQVVELMFGRYDEEDIIRLADDYGRCTDSPNHA